MGKSVKERIADATAELNRVEALGEEGFHQEIQLAEIETANTRKAIAEARENRVGKKRASGVGRARQMGIPAAAIPRCGAHKTTSEGTCQQPAGTGTSHFGKGRCKYHGGNTPSTHGRYSGLFNDSLDSVYEHFRNDEDPLDLTSDIVLIRGLTEKFINEYDVWLASILAWYESFSEGKLGPPKPQKVIELTDVYKLLETCSKMVERERKARAANAISARDLFRMLNEIGRIIEMHIEDKDVLKSIRQDMLSIRYA